MSLRRLANWLRAALDRLLPEPAPEPVLVPVPVRVGRRMHPPTAPR